jgi:hypothetical protein
MFVIAAFIVVIAVLLVLDQRSVTQNPKTMPWMHVHGLGIDPSDREVLYIATHGDFYVSISGGPPVKVDKERADYMAFNAPYVEDAPLYASGHPATGGNMGLVKSTDGGQTWETVATILEPPVDFHAMTTSRSDPTIIIGFDSAGRGLFTTYDAGVSWKKMEPPGYISALAIHPDDPKIVFAGTGKGVFMSNDGVNTWSQLEQPKNALVYALGFDENGVLYASVDRLGLVQSSDLGKSWQMIDAPNLTVTSITVDAQNQIIYVAGYSPDGFQEVYFSKDVGETWILIGTNKEL